MTLTKADIENDPDLSQGMGDLSAWEPLVEWVDHVGAFSIGHTVIFHCPWCGTRLPEHLAEMEARVRETGTWVGFGADGGVSVTVAAQPVDPEAFFAEMRELTKDQD